MDGEKIWALLDTGCQINTVTPRLVEALGLEVLPMKDLVGDQKKECIIGVGGSAVQPKGYVVVNLQVDAANSYNEDAIAIVIPDASGFASRVPMIIGTCTLGRVVEAMKESELDTLTPQWDMCHKGSLADLEKACKSKTTLVDAREIEEEQWELLANTLLL